MELAAVRVIAACDYPVTPEIRFVPPLETERAIQVADLGVPLWIIAGTIYSVSGNWRSAGNLRKCHGEVKEEEQAHKRGHHAHGPRGEGGVPGEELHFWELGV